MNQPSKSPTKHQKWWGWGPEDGIRYAIEDKPKFPDFAMRKLGMDISGAKVIDDPRFEDLDVPASIAGEALLSDLTGIVGEDETWGAGAQFSVRF